MNRQANRGIWVVLLAAVVLMPATARGDMIGDLLVGLDYANFQFAGQRNPLSDGVTLQTARNFNNTPIDFGFTDLVLTGPVTGVVTTANRGIRSLDFSFTAGADGNPLLYTYTSNVGGTNVTVDGSAVMNMAGSINQFGWYDFQFELSSRQDASSTGRFADEDLQLDYDIGPINVSGNIFADLLATLTDPLFEAAGFENIFASFSGRTARESALESTVSRARTKLDAGKELTFREMSDLYRMAAEADFHGDDVPDLGFLRGAFDAAIAEVRTEGVVAPEPTTALLLLLPACLYRRSRRA